jgi:serum/glucocorticoid-regulated kinase 2
MGNCLASNEGDPSRFLLNQNHFELKHIINKGNFGMVWLAKKKSNKQEYAMKIILKSYIYKKKYVSHVMNEYKLMKTLRHPFLVNMNYAFQDIEHLYLVADFLFGADLSYYLVKLQKKFT